MPKKRYTPEEIVAKLRQVDVLVSQGQNIADAIRQIGVSEVTFYRWSTEAGLELTFHLDHPMGSHHTCGASSPNVVMTPTFSPINSAASSGSWLQTFRGIPELDNQVLALTKPGRSQTLPERSHPRRARGEAPGHRTSILDRLPIDRARPAEQPDELAALHSITSSARARTVVGMSMRSALAVLRLITSWYLAACSTGRSAGFAPFRILSMYVAASRVMSRRSGA